MTFAWGAESWPISRAGAALFGEIELSVPTETDSFTVARYRGQGCRSLTALGRHLVAVHLGYDFASELARPAQPRLVRRRSARERILFACARTTLAVRCERVKKPTAHSPSNACRRGVGSRHRVEAFGDGRGLSRALNQRGICAVPVVWMPTVGNCRSQMPMREPR